MVINSMAITQQRDFLAQIPPFDHLEEALLNELADSMNVVYLPHKKVIEFKDALDKSFLYILIKGKVAEIDDGEVTSRYSVRGFFGDTDILSEAERTSHYEVQEEAIAYKLPAKLFIKAFETNHDFAHFFNSSIVEKLNRIHQAVQSATSTEVMMDTVCSAPLQSYVSLSKESTLHHAAKLMVEKRTDACIVEFDDSEIGIVTSTDILKLLAKNEPNLASLTLGKLANKPVQTVHEFDYLFNALLKMTRFQIDRLVVRGDQGYRGFLHQKDLMSLFANQSGLVLLKVEQAQSVTDLVVLGEQIDGLIGNLNRKGIKTHYIAKLVNELHRKMIYKLVEFLLPTHLANKVCIFVMGSEGRSEQVIRTDQDNALIYSDELTDNELIELEQFSSSFIETLQQMGFPPCPGNIMLSNTDWRMSQSDFMLKVAQWFANPSEENFMHAAILFDAEAVFGQKEWLSELKETLQNEKERYSNFLRLFAVSVLRFKTPIGFLGGLVVDSEAGHEVIDIKKGGIFSIVHGVRCYALEAGISKTNTHWRIKALMDAGVFEKEFGIELGETLNFLNTLRLESMLHQLADGCEIPDNKIRLSELSHMQQGLLKQSFGVVDDFKKRINHHFALDGLL
ncbi:putative nucleotidyltransferase substrate binding domain-containing protein [Thiomicrorhabdus sp.]|uniref:putative nucleotidyltransferase substrate binding domain-containing protein n=1 Tax=Thiomicrorhabdus sp. TaxID=2039724 RepID=UPI002AA73AF1|nr:putative nucleotidyltransferase substrate binding domain-containing protein [Thiomicrorhabdus sp.]